MTVQILFISTQMSLKKILCECVCECYGPFTLKDSFQHTVDVAESWLSYNDKLTDYHNYCFYVTGLLDANAIG